MMIEVSASTVMERCDILACYSEDSTDLTRRYATMPMRQVNDIIAAWMRAANMTVYSDAAGNLIGRYAGNTAGAKTLLIGSHLDTVRGAGRYDGILGVMVALASVERLQQRGIRLPFAIEVLGFADEEGMRYHLPYIGSRVMVGSFDPTVLSFTDEAGITMSEAIRQFGGNPDPTVLCTPRWRRDDLLGYCEVHIEQGPVLDAQNIPVGVVSAIAGQNRYSVEFTGKAGHAGTVPMDMRQDALCAASEFILAVEDLGRQIPALVATVGKIQADPDASNVIPGHVAISLDVRHQDDAVREAACKKLRERAQLICQRRGVTTDWQFIQENKTVACAPHLALFLARAIEESGYPVHTLQSGAGHDAVILSALTDVAMLFVRCKDGISHHRDESIREEDVAVSLDIVESFLRQLCGL